MSTRLSIIIPVYNTEKYLERCLDSCITQDISSNEYEVIIINDGSTDSSIVIAEKYASKYNNVHVFSQPNSGLSMARNTGMDRSKGDYVMLLDSDDWISSNCFKKIVGIFDDKNLDMLKISAANVFGDIIKRRYSVAEGTVFTGMELLKRGLDFCAPFTIYRRSFLEEHKLRFMPKVFHEDNEFTPRAYYFAQRVACINDIIYFVYQSPNSITRSINPRKAYDSISVSESLSSFCENLDDESKKVFHNVIGSTLNVSLHNSIMMPEDEKNKFKLFLSDHIEVFSHLRGCSSFKYKVEGLLISLFPKHILDIYETMLKLDYRKRNG